MKTLYFTEKDLSIRLKEMRQQFWGLVEEEQLEIAKRRLEEALRTEFSESLGASRYERNKNRQGYRGGYRYRDLKTWTGVLSKVKVPKGEKGYRFKLLDPWKRHVEKFGEAVYRAFVYGLSDRKVSKFFEGLYGGGILSRSGASVIYRSMCDDIEGWHKRTLSHRYRFLFLDGMHQSVRNTIGHHRVVLAALGITHEGVVELIDFRVETGESASAWGRFVQNLYERGLTGQNLELIAHDGCPGLIDALRWVWPRTKTQLCAVHHLRNLGQRIKARHIRCKVLREAKWIYRADNRIQALNKAKILAKRWGRCEPKAIRNFMNRLEETLVYMDFSKEMWPLLKSTNILERFIEEWRRRLKVMGALPNPASCDRIIYALSREFNQQQKKANHFLKSELILT